jgi:release factor glutamine methyltransferase
VALVDQPTVQLVRRAARRRAAGAPFAYAVGQAAFRFLNLAVDERVLIPRPETERLVDLVLARPQAQAGGVAADIGTGSGAIALALAAEGRFRHVIATDVSMDALVVAAHNRQAAAGSLRAPVELRAGSDLSPITDASVDVLVANPPYIAYDEMPGLPRLVRDWEPTHALCCSEQGLHVTAAIVADAPRVLKTGGLLALEVDSRRAGVVARLVATTEAFLDAQILPDYTGRERFVLAVRS